MNKEDVVTPSLIEDLPGKPTLRHFESSGGQMPASEYDAPPSILKEYEDLVKKYVPDTEALKNYPTTAFSPKIPDDVQTRLIRLYRQMTHSQQAVQLVGFIHMPKALPKGSPTETQFSRWEKDADCGVFVDMKQIKNTELVNYGPTDFDLYTVTAPTEQAAAKYHFHKQVDLMSKKRYSLYIKSFSHIKEVEIVHQKQHYHQPKHEETAVPQMITGKYQDYPSAAHDAPQIVLDEYITIEKRYKAYRSKQQPYMIGAPHLPDSVDTRLRKLYLQMSKKQQQQQIIYYVLHTQRPKVMVTNKNLSEWQDAKTYGVWLDNKRINNHSLTQCKPGELVLAFKSTLTPIAIKNDGFRYQLDLMTESYYTEMLNKLKEENGKGGFRMFNFELLRKNKATMDEFTTDEKPEFLPKHVIDAEKNNG